MMAVLIADFWLLAFLALAGDVRRSLRAAAFTAFLATCSVVLLSTELLSLLRALRIIPVAVSWLAASLILGVLLRARIKSGYRRIRAAGLPKPQGWGEVTTAAILTFFGVGTLLSALLYPTTNYDSLTYHMPRVFFWYQNHSVGFFPTSEARQLFSGAFVEYFVLHLKVLALGSDRLAPMVQWLSYMFVTLAVSLIAERLGADRRGQLAAAVAAATLPMAVLQSSTTQNDLTAALWALVCAFYVLGYVMGRDEGKRVFWTTFLPIGAASALAVQSKPTAYLFLAPLFVWLAVAAVRRERWTRAAALIASVAVVAIVLNSGLYARNAHALGADVLALDAPGNQHILVRDRSPGGVATNALKNISMELGTPSVTFNRYVAAATAGFVRAIGEDIENPLNKEDPEQSYELDARVASHDVAPAPLTMVVTCFAVVVMLLSRAGRSSPIRWYLICAAASIVLVAGLVKWNHYVNRVLLGSMLLAVPLVGVALTQLASRRSRARWVLIGLLGIATIWGAAAMLLNPTNRLLPTSLLPVSIGSRDVGYWNTAYDDLRFRVLAPQFEAPMKAIARAIASEDVNSVGLRVDVPNFPIYPLLPLLSDAKVGYVAPVVLGERIEHAFTPDVIVEVAQVGGFAGSPEEGVPRVRTLVPDRRVGDVVLMAYRARGR